MLVHLRLHQLSRDDGATAIEYALLVTLIAAVIFAAVALVGQDILPGFQQVEAGLP